MYPHRTKCAPLRGMPIGQAHHNLATTIFSKRYTHIDSNMGEGSSKEVSRSVSLVGCVDDPATSTFEGDFLVWGDEVPYWDTIPWGWSAVSPEAGSACEGHPYEMGIGIVDFYIPSSLGKLNFTNQHKVVSVKHILDGEKIADDLCIIALNDWGDNKLTAWWYIDEGSLFWKDGVGVKPENDVLTITCTSHL